MPADGALANPIGLAIAPAGAQAHRICQNRPEQRDRAVAEAREEAMTRAITRAPTPTGSPSSRSPRFRSP